VLTATSSYSGRMTQPPRRQADRNGTSLALGIALGSALGAALGAAFGNVGLGAAFGAAFGVVAFTLSRVAR
jgi:hypothetical protein